MAEHSFFHVSGILTCKNGLTMSDNWTSFGPTFFICFKYPFGKSNPLCPMTRRHLDTMVPYS